MRSAAPRLPYEPTPLQILLLRAALLDGDAAIDAWERSKHVADDVRRLDEATYRLLPQLYRNLLDHGVDDPLMKTLKGVYRHSWYCNQRLFHEAAGLLEQLHGAGIETIVLKGAALTNLYYRDPGSRPMEDLDVLVRRADVDHAVGTLRAGGWSLVRALPLDAQMRTTHAACFDHPRGHEIDLHWSLLWEPVPDEDYWKRTVPTTVGGVATRALEPVDQLIHICVHGIGWFPAPGRWIADAITVIRATGRDLDWDRLADQAERWHVSARLETALHVLGETFDVPVPEAPLERIRRARRPLRERLPEHVLRHPPPRGGNYVLLWGRYRRLRANGSGADDGFTGYIRDCLGLDSRTAVPGYLARRMVECTREDLARRRDGSVSVEPEAASGG